MNLLFLRGYCFWWWLHFVLLDLPVQQVFWTFLHFMYFVNDPIKDLCPHQLIFSIRRLSPFSILLTCAWFLGFLVVLFLGYNDCLFLFVDKFTLKSEWVFLLELRRGDIVHLSVYPLFLHEFLVRIQSYHFNIILLGYYTASFWSLYRKRMIL